MVDYRGQSSPLGYSQFLLPFNLLKNSFFNRYRKDTSEVGAVSLKNSYVGGGNWGSTSNYRGEEVVPSWNFVFFNGAPDGSRYACSGSGSVDDTNRISVVSSASASTYRCGIYQKVIPYDSNNTCQFLLNNVFTYYVKVSNNGVDAGDVRLIFNYGDFNAAMGTGTSEISINLNVPVGGSYEFIGTIRFDNVGTPSDVKGLRVCLLNPLAVGSPLNYTDISYKKVLLLLGDHTKVLTSGSISSGGNTYADLFERDTRDLFDYPSIEGGLYLPDYEVIKDTVVTTPGDSFSPVSIQHDLGSRHLKVDIFNITSPDTGSPPASYLVQQFDSHIKYINANKIEVQFFTVAPSYSAGTITWDAGAGQVKLRYFIRIWRLPNYYGRSVAYNSDPNLSFYDYGFLP